MLKINKNAILGIVLLGCLQACTTVTTRTELQEVGSIDGNGTVKVTRQNERVDRQEASGQATLLWEEPMVDVVDVPPGLDPEGHYYRPAHKSIIEIRQGRWQYYDRRKQN